MNLGASISENRPVGPFISSLRTRSVPTLILGFPLPGLQDLVGDPAATSGLPRTGSHRRERPVFGPNEFGSRSHLIACPGLALVRGLTARYYL